MDIEKLKDKVKRLKFKYDFNKEELQKIKINLEELGVVDLKDVDTFLKSIQNDIENLEKKEKNYFEKAKIMLEKIEGGNGI